MLQTLPKLFQATFNSGSLSGDFSTHQVFKWCLADVAEGCIWCLPHISLLPLLHWRHKPGQSQATLGHSTFWPLVRVGLRGFPQIFFDWSRDYEWNALALISSFALCLQHLLLAFILQSTFIQCILIIRFEIKNNVFQN